MSTSDSPERKRLTREQIESAAHEQLGAQLNSEGMRRIVDSSLEIDSALDRIVHEPMRLGRIFAELTSTVTPSYIENFGDSQETRRRAMAAVFEHLTHMHGVSQSKARLYIHAWQKFQAPPEALAV